MNSKKIIKFKSVLKQNNKALFFVISWFFCNFIYFLIATTNFLEAFLILFYFKNFETLYGNFYVSFTEFIIFGLVFSLITVELFRKYNPIETCRELAKNYNDHAIIIGYTNLGKRLVNYFRENDIDYILIESNYDLVEDLILKEEPIINEDPLDFETLDAAAVRNAKAIYITNDDLEIQFVVSAHIRDLNKSCKLFCRIFEDDIADFVAKTYNAEIISTSKYASDIIFGKIRKNNFKNILIIGLNHISMRLIEKFKTKDYIKFHIIEQDEELIKKSKINNSLIIQGDPTNISYLHQVEIEEIDCIINLNQELKNCIIITKQIRDLNRNCKIISRIFQDDIAEILEKPPFRAEGVSSSKNTLEIMKINGLLDF